MHSNGGSEYYGWYNEAWRNPGPFARYLQECGIKARYAMLSKQNRMALLNIET